MQIFLNDYEIRKNSMETMHILPGTEHRITDIIDILRSNGLNFSVKRNAPRSYDVQKFIGNSEKCEEFLKDFSFMDLETGIRKLIEIYKSKSKK